MHQFLKIAITDEVQLKSVCDVLETMGYTKECSGLNYETLDTEPAVVAHQDGIYAYYCHKNSGGGSSLITLNDLIALRDEGGKK